MSIVAQAIAAQTSGAYRADVWLAIRLRSMMKVWQGIGGHSNFFVSEEDAREASGAYGPSVPHQFAQTLWRLAQVRPNPGLGFRQGIREFVVDMDTESAIGICSANPELGSGSVLQYFIPDWQRTLHPTGREHRFGASGYS